MNFESLKASFFNKMGIQNSSENLLKYISEFQNYAQNQGYDSSIFSQSINDVQVNNGKFVDKSGDSFINSMNDLLNDSSIVNLFDTSGNSQLSSSELKEMIELMSNMDGSSGDLSINDFAKLKEKINSGEISDITDLGGKKKTEKKNEKKDKKELDNLNQANGAGSASGASGAGSSSGAGTSSVSPSSGATQAFGGVESATASSKETSSEIEEINRKIEEQRKEKAEQIKEKSEAKKDDVKYNEMLTSLQTVMTDLSTAESNVTTFEQEVHEKETSIAAKQSELDALEAQGAPEVFDEYKDDYADKIQKLRDEIADLDRERGEKQAALDEEREKVESLKNQETKLNQDIQKYEQENPDEKIDECNDKIKECDDEIKELEKEKQEKENEIKEERKQEKGDAEVYGKAQAYRENEFVKFMMDYATDPATKAKYDEMYKSFQGAYCAVFTSEVTEVLYAAVMDKLGLSKEDLYRMMSGLGDTNGNGQSVTGNQMSMESYTWGQKIQNALNACGINATASIDITKMTEEEKRNAVREGKIYPGMTFEYKRPNGGYHTGFIESINPDLSWNTIEGNTSIELTDGSRQNNTVGSHTNNALSCPITTATNSISKVLVWLEKTGKLSSDEINRKYIYNA